MLAFIRSEYRKRFPNQKVFWVNVMFFSGLVFNRMNDTNFVGSNVYFMVQNIQFLSNDCSLPAQIKIINRKSSFKYLEIYTILVLATPNLLSTDKLYCTIKHTTFGRSINFFNRFLLFCNFLFLIKASIKTFFILITTFFTSSILII